jgi:hypothetical protein
VRGLVQWSGAHLVEVDAARAAYDARNKGRPDTAPRLEERSRAGAARFRRDGERKLAGNRAR